MPYIEEVCVAGKTIEVSKYHSCRWNCKGERRGKKIKETPESQKKINQRIASKNLRRILNATFEDGDYLVTYDFRKRERPETSTQMQDVMREFLKQLRKEFKKNKLELKYVYVKELGPRGASHIHMVMSKCDLSMLTKCWEHGGVDIQPLYSNGQYADIADYFVKYADRTIKTEGQLIGKRWYASRNVIRPIPEKRVIKRVNTFYTKIKERDGYYVDKDSVLEGVTRDGFEYFSYTLHQLDNTHREKERWREKGGQAYETG